MNPLIKPFLAANPALDVLLARLNKRRKADINDWLETEQFYNAMQAYRFASTADQENVVAAFEEVKRLLRRYFGPDRCAYPDITAHPELGYTSNHGQ